MRSIHRFNVSVCTVLALLWLSSCASDENDLPIRTASVPIPAKLVEANGAYRIIRNDEPYFIKGAGGSYDLDLLVASGGNSVRTWDTRNAQQVLDEAYARGLTVMLGLDMGKERHGFDYSDKAAVAEQKARMRKEILKYKDHPALLAWGIGNELDLFYTNTDVWLAVEDVAAMIKALDPAHLVTTVTAGITQDKVALIVQRVPSIDYLSINVYGDLDTLPGKLLEYGYPGPYVVTEWGPTGHWETPKTDWGAPVEQTSTQKAASYRHRYDVGILSAPDRALGSYAFFWDQKQETTPTWYGVFTEQGKPTEVIDSLHYLWSGAWPAQRAPSISAFTLQGKTALSSIKVKTAARLKASLSFTPGDSDNVQIRWEILPESTDIKSGGDPESRPQPIEGLIEEMDEYGNLVFIAPPQSGAYRLFVSLENDLGKVANANIPFFVQ